MVRVNSQSRQNELLLFSVFFSSFTSFTFSSNICADLIVSAGPTCAHRGTQTHVCMHTLFLEVIPAGNLTVTYCSGSQLGIFQHLKLSKPSVPTPEAQ